MELEPPYALAAAPWKKIILTGAEEQSSWYCWFLLYSKHSGKQNKIDLFPTGLKCERR